MLTKCSDDRMFLHSTCSNNTGRRQTQFVAINRQRYSCLENIVLTHNLTFVTMDFLYGECRARLACTYVQSDLALPSPLLYHYFLSKNGIKPIEIG